jgi:methylated-DNA-[protein]-cysteine S-methyltransferase
MTTMTQKTLFDLDATLRARLKPGGIEAELVRRIVRRARRRLATLERIRRDFVVDASEEGIVAIRPGGHASCDGAAARRIAEQGREELHEYLGGRRSFFAVPVDLARLPEFQRRVLDEARAIPFGETRSYSFLARRVGNAGAARAVGTALGRNPVPFIVPCHRVLRGDDTLGGYAFGLAMKTDLLELERTTPVLEACATTRILCRVGCPALDRARFDNRIVFAGVADARTVGYRPCRICRPDVA